MNNDPRSIDERRDYVTGLMRQHRADWFAKERYRKKGNLVWTGNVEAGMVTVLVLQESSTPNEEIDEDPWSAWWDLGGEG